MFSTIALAALATASPLSHQPPSGEIGALVRVEVLGYTCSDMTSDSSWADLPNGDVEVHDGHGRPLGASRLDEGEDTLSSCVFEAQFMIKETSDGLYEVTFGDPQVRGELEYTADENVFFTDGFPTGTSDKPAEYWDLEFLDAADITIGDANENGVFDEDEDATSEDPPPGVNWQYDYQMALDAWSIIPAGEDLCPEFAADLPAPEMVRLIHEVYPGLNEEAVMAALDSQCG